MSRTEAYRAAEEFIAAHGTSVEGGLAIVEEMTIEKPYGWIFFYNSKRYLETGSPLEALGGNGPLVVTPDGSVTPISSAQEPSIGIAEYERALGFNA